MNHAKDHQIKHSLYCEKLKKLIEASQLQYEEIYVEQDYGKYMDFENMEKTGGHTYGDFDVLVDLGGEYLCVEVKTCPRT